MEERPLLLSLHDVKEEDTKSFDLETVPMLLSIMSSSLHINLLDLDEALELLAKDPAQQCTSHEGKGSLVHLSLLRDNCQHSGS